MRPLLLHPCTSLQYQYRNIAYLTSDMDKSGAEESSFILQDYVMMTVSAMAIDFTLTLKLSCTIPILLVLNFCLTVSLLLLIFWAS